VLSTVFALNDELLNGVVYAKYFWFYISMGISTLILAVYSLFLRNSNIKIKFTLSDLLLLFICLIGLLPFLSGTEAANTPVIQMVLLFVLYFHFRIIFSFGKFYQYVLLLFVITTALIESTWGLSQLYGFTFSQHTLFRLTGSFFNPGPYAGYLAVIVPGAFFYLLADYKILTRKFNKRYVFFYVRWVVSASTSLVVLLVLPAAMSRAAWLAALGGCGFAGLMFLSRNYCLKEYIKRHRNKVMQVAVLLSVLLIIGSWGMYRLKKDSADGRALIWKNTVTAIVKSPLGVGLGNFAGAYGNEQAAYFDSGQASEREKLIAGNPEYAFNEYLQIALEFGIAGLILFLVLMGYVLNKGIKNGQYASVASLSALLIFALMSYPFSVLPFLIVFVFLIATCVTEDTGMSKGVKIPAGLLLAVTCIVVAACLYNRYPVYKAYKDWKQVKVMYAMDLYADTKGTYEGLFPYLNDNAEFLFEYGRILSKTGNHSASNNILRQGMKKNCDPMFYNISGQNYQSLQNYILAEQQFKKAACMVPHRIYPYYLLTKLYIEMGEKQKAMEMASIVLQKEPKVHSPAIDEMRMEIRNIIEKTE